MPEHLCHHAKAILQDKQSRAARSDHYLIIKTSRSHLCTIAILICEGAGAIPPTPCAPRDTPTMWQHHRICFRPPPQAWRATRHLHDMVKGVGAVIDAE